MNAIVISEPAFNGDTGTYAVVKNKKCVGCGLCVRECPLEAIRMMPPVRVEAVVADGQQAVAESAQ